MGNDYPSFSEFSKEEVNLKGTKKKLEEILNVRILVTGYRAGRSKYREKEYLTLQFENDGETHIVFTGSEVLLRQAKSYAEQMPFYTIIKKVNNYYTMT